MTPIQFPIAAEPYQPRDFVLKIARSPKEVEGFRRLRRAVFYEEQKVFQGSDEDEHDRTMLPIISLSLIAGMEDEVVGVVRIDQREPGV